MIDEGERVPLTGSPRASLRCFTGAVARHLPGRARPRRRRPSPPSLPSVNPPDAVRPAERLATGPCGGRVGVTDGEAGDVAAAEDGVELHLRVAPGCDVDPERPGDDADFRSC